MTTTPGSGTRGRRCSSRRTFCKACVSATTGSLLLLLLGVPRARLLDGVAAELAAQGREDLHGEGVVLARGEAGEEGAGDGIGRYALVYGLHHRPSALAGVLYVAADGIEVRVLREGVLGEFRSEER